LEGLWEQDALPFTVSEKRKIPNASDLSRINVLKIYIFSKKENLNYVR
jgi:hypothetical protein